MKFFSFFLTLLLVSCALIPDIPIQETDMSQVELGIIGLIDKKMVEAQFTATSIPEINEKIRIVPSERQFDKGLWKKYARARESRGLSNKENDSINKQKTYLNLSIGDKVTWIKELCDKKNKVVMTYLKFAEKPVLITSVSLMLPDATQQDIVSAEEVYLVTNRRKNYQLELYKDSKLVRTVDLSHFMAFDYQASQFCWVKEMSKEITVADISTSRCKKPMEISYQKIEKKKTVLNF